MDHQSIVDLKDCPAHLKGDAVVGAVVENAKFKVVPRVMDPDTRYDQCTEELITRAMRSKEDRACTRYSTSAIMHFLSCLPVKLCYRIPLQLSGSGLRFYPSDNNAL